MLTVPGTDDRRAFNTVITGPATSVDRAKPYQPRCLIALTHVDSALVNKNTPSPAKVLLNGAKERQFQIGIYATVWKVCGKNQRNAEQAEGTFLISGGYAALLARDFDPCSWNAEVDIDADVSDYWETYTGESKRFARLDRPA